MSGYLSNLASRILARTLDVRPRVLSFFEPPAFGGEAALESETRIEAARRSLPVREAEGSNREQTAAVIEPPQGGSNRSLVSRPYSPPDPPSSEEQERRALRREDRQSTHSVSPERSEANSEREAISPAAARLSSTLLPAAPSVSVQAPVIAAREATPSRSAEGPLSNAQPAPSAPHAGDAAGDLMESHPALRNSPHIQQDLVPARSGIRIVPAVIAAPLSMPRGYESGRPDSISVREPEAPPSIRVTIGRVDVRAVMPLAPAPRAPSERKSPRLTLDEYLSQRTGGQR